MSGAVGLGSELSWHCDKGYHTIHQLLGVKNTPSSAVAEETPQMIVLGEAGVHPAVSRATGGKPSAKGLTVLTQKQPPSQHLLNLLWNCLGNVLLFHSFSY